MGAPCAGAVRRGQGCLCCVAPSSPSTCCRQCACMVRWLHVGERSPASTSRRAWIKLWQPLCIRIYVSPAVQKSFTGRQSVTQRWPGGVPHCGNKKRSCRTALCEAGVCMHKLLFISLLPEGRVPWALIPLLHCSEPRGSPSSLGPHAVPMAHHSSTGSGCGMQPGCPEQAANYSFNFIVFSRRQSSSLC